MDKQKLIKEEVMPIIPKYVVENPLLAPDTTRLYDNTSFSQANQLMSGAAGEFVVKTLRKYNDGEQYQHIAIMYGATPSLTLAMGYVGGSPELTTHEDFTSVQAAITTEFGE